MLRHAQLQLVYEKYRQLVVLSEMSAEMSDVKLKDCLIPSEIVQVKKICPHSFALKAIESKFQRSLNKYECCRRQLQPS
jgi:hypothetical protein